MAHRFICWRSNYRTSLEDLVNNHSLLEDYERRNILFLVSLYAHVFDYSSFQLLRIGDDKYCFIFQLTPDGVRTIKITLFK